MAGDVGEFAFHHASDVVHGCLSLVDENHFPWFEACYLTHHFAADASCGTGDEYAVCVELSADGQHVNFYLVAWQEVLDVHLMQLAVPEFALSVPFLSREWHHHDFDVSGDEFVDECFLFAEVYCL